MYQGLNKVLVTTDLDIINEVFVRQFDNFHGRRVNPLTGNPDTAKRIHLSFARGARWKRLRTITNPAFSTANLKRIHATVEDSAVELVKHLEKTSNTEIDISDYFNEFTLDTICRISLGQSTSKMFNNPLFESVRNFFAFNSRNPILMLAHCTLLPVILLRISFIIIGTLFSRSLTSAFLTVLKTITKAVDERIKQREDDEKRGFERGEPSDFIDLFLDAKAEEDFVTDGTEFSKNNLTVAKTLTREEIKGQLMIFLLAGFDTTANTLSYVAFLLAKHPDKLRKLQEEVDRECGQTTAVDYEHLGKFKYMEAIIKETLRLYPLAASVNVRQCMNSTTVCGLAIEKGTFIQVDTWTLHHDKSIWGVDVEEFRPERWLNKIPHPTGAYLPFGAGPRICIGKRLALNEIKLALCHIIRNFDIVEGPNTGKELSLHGAALVHPDHVKVIIKPRN